MATSSQASLFGDMEEVQIQNPDFPIADKWSNLKRLNMEKDLIGFYLSGHPLDTYEDTFKYFISHTNANVLDLVNRRVNTQVKFAGIVTRAVVKESISNGNKYGFFTVEDKSGSIEFPLFTDKFLKYSHLMQIDNYVYVEANIKDGFRDKTKSELNIDTIGMLDVVLNDKATKFNIQLILDDLTENMVNEIVENAKKNPGNVSLNLFIKDGSTYLEMRPKKIKVEAQAFLEFLKTKPDIIYKLN